MSKADDTLLRAETRKMVSSPLRYPGGKGSFYSFFAQLMDQNGITGRYVEPFAGGAGLALRLLSTGAVSAIVLNDADYHIFCFWLSALYTNGRFVEAIQNAELTISEWKRQRAVYDEPDKYTAFEVGFSAFYLNRCNRSGILGTAGPIGGYGQQGAWRLDARFNRDNLVSRIAAVGQLSHDVNVTNMDAVDFMETHLPSGTARNNTLVYVDPPYIGAGKRLYLNKYSYEDHRALARYLLSQTDLTWLLTYDDNPLTRDLYAECRQWTINSEYSVQAKQIGRELLIAPDCLTLPEEHSSTSKRWRIDGKTDLRRISDETDEILSVLSNC